MLKRCWEKVPQPHFAVLSCPSFQRMVTRAEWIQAVYGNNANEDQLELMGTEVRVKEMILTHSKLGLSGSARHINSFENDC